MPQSTQSLDDLKKMTPKQRHEFVDVMNDYPNSLPNIPPYPAGITEPSHPLPYPNNPDVLNSPYITGELMATGKHWTQSKTMWFNIAVAVFGAISTILFEVSPYFDTQAFTLLTTVIALINMVLRSMTTTEIITRDKPL